MTDLRAYQPSFTAGELSPALWARTDLARYQTGLKLAKNVFIHPHGGVSNRAGMRFVGETKLDDVTSEVRLVPFQFNVEQTYILEFGHLYMRVWRDSGIILSGGSPFELVTPYTSAQVRSLVFSQDADIMYITHEAHAPGKLSRFAEDNWTLTTPTFAPMMTAPGTLTVTRVSGTGSTTYRYRVSAVSDDTGEESLPSPIGSITNDLTLAGAANRVAWAAVAGAGRYIVYKEDNGVYGYIGGTEGLSFDDDNITPDLSDTPQRGYNPFVGAGNYPRCSTFVDQRLAFAATLNNPQAIWMSQSGAYENFGFSRPRKDSDGFEFRARTRRVNRIEGMMPTKDGLLMLTSGAEFTVTGADNGPITPSQVRVQPQSYFGASPLQPIVVGNVVLFAQNRGGVVRDFSYEFANDAFVGKDLTILARHLFEDRRIVAWDYAQAPHSIIWVVLDTGKLVSLTYMREHEVWGWTQHETSGFVRDVAVVNEGEYDAPYFVVDRQTGDDVWHRYLERLDDRDFEGAVEDAFFVDSGLTYTGAPADEILGLDHLEGREVVALSEGNVVRGLTVTGGKVTLPRNTTKAHIGLPYEATIKTLDLDLGSVAGKGSIQGRTKSIAEVTFRVEDTRGIWLGHDDYGRDDPRMIEFKQRSTEPYGQAIQLLTGDFEITPVPEWTKGGNVVVKQFDPLPMTILAIMPDVLIGS